MVYFTPPDSNDSLTRLVLGYKEYVFHFSYNYHSDFWSMGIYENYNTPIIADMKIVPEFPLYSYFEMAELPEGHIFVESTLAHIGRKDFVKGNARIVFVSKTEFDEYVEAMKDESILG